MAKREPAESEAIGPMFTRLIAEVVESAKAGSSLLVIGPTGCGKERLLRAYVRSFCGDRRVGEIVNCGAFAPELLDSELFGHVHGAFTGAVKNREGLIARCDVIALDEIGDASPAFQTRLLRAMEYGEYRPVGESRVKKKAVVFVAATNNIGALRRDLIWRFGHRVVVPPLWRRRRDLIAIFFAVAQSCGLRSITSRCLRFLLSDYAWPGNVREVQFLLAEMSRRLGDAPLDLEHLPMRTPNAMTTPTAGPKTWALDGTFVERADEEFGTDQADLTAALEQARYEMLAGGAPDMSEAEFRRRVSNGLFEVGKGIREIEGRLADSFFEVSSVASHPDVAAREAARAWFESRQRAGKTMQDMANEMGCSRQNVGQRLRDLGLRPDRAKR